MNLDTRYVVKCSDGLPGYIVGVTNGPRDLLFRGTEAAALRDGAEYVSAHYEQTPEGWRVRGGSGRIITG